MASPAARIIAKSTSNHTHETVNIVSSANLPDAQKGKVKRHQQVTGAVAAAMKGAFKTLQDSGGTVKGLRTIHIPGYSGPN